MYERSYHNLNFIRIWPEKTAFFEGWPWFKFNNWRLAPGRNLKSYNSKARRLKLEVRKFWVLILTFVEVAGELFFRKTRLGGLFASPLYLPSILNRVKTKNNLHFAMKFIKRSTFEHSPCSKIKWNYNTFISCIKIFRSCQNST